MTGPTPDAAVTVQGFAQLIAAGDDVAAQTAILAWCSDQHVDETERTRYFATTATTLVVARVRASTGQRPEDHWVLRRNRVHTRRSQLVPDVHDTVMRQVVVSIANGQPHVALDLLNAHKSVHGTAGLFWVGVFAVRMLANLLTNETRTP